MSDSPPAARGYSSKLRTRQKEQTGELILSSVAALLNILLSRFVCWVHHRRQLRRFDENKTGIKNN